MSEELCANFSKKVQEIAKAPKYRGAIFQIEADEKGLALVDVKEASLKVYLMIDPECDKILETRFFTYGGPIFTALADTFCKKIQMATVEEACAITAESIERELREEMDVHVSVKESDLYMTVHHDYPDFSMTMYAFYCHLDKPDFVRKEHVDAKWMTPEDMPTLDWAPADVPIMKKLSGK